MARQPGAKFVDVPFVREQIESAIQAAAQDFMGALRGDIVSQLEHSTGVGDTSGRWHLSFDSPLEAAYWAWWRATESSDSFISKLALDRHVEVVVEGERYVLDAVISLSSVGVETPVKAFVRDRWPRVAIELDGHTFHEKTLEQVTRRNKRDRDLQRVGWRVFHYSFSEFVNNAAMCVIEPVDFAREVYSRLMNDHHASTRQGAN